MPSLTEFGLLVALGLMTALVFQGYYFPGTPGQTTSQSDGRPGKADPDGYRFDPEKMSRPFQHRSHPYHFIECVVFSELSETVKLNWCKENPDRCPMGKFPTEGPEADLVRHLSAAHDTLIPSSINVGQGNDGFWPPTPDPLGPSFVVDNDRCCPTNTSFLTMVGEKTDHNKKNGFFPPFSDYQQTVQIGVCCGGGQGCGEVQGTCKQKTRLSQKLCRRNEILQGSPGDNVIVTAWFEVEAFCSCNTA